jgi:hypothetical protein
LNVAEIHNSNTDLVALSTKCLTSLMPKINLDDQVIDRTMQLLLHIKVAKIRHEFVQAIQIN